MESDKVYHCLYRACADWASLYNKSLAKIPNERNKLISYRDNIYNQLINNKKTLIDVLGPTIPLKDNNQCVYCGGKVWSIDHIIPQDMGGTEHPDNLVPCCSKCNSSKRNKNLIIWMEEYPITPSLELIQRYLKQLYVYCLNNNLVYSDISSINNQDLRESLLKMDGFLMRLLFDEDYSNSQITLIEAVTKYVAKIPRPGILKHLRHCGINDWTDCSQEKMIQLHDYLLNNLSPNSARFYSAIICSLFEKAGANLVFSGYRSILYIGKDNSSQISLTSEELDRLINVAIKGKYDIYVKCCFLIEACIGINRKNFEQLHIIHYKNGKLEYTYNGEWHNISIDYGEHIIEWFNIYKRTNLDLPPMSYNRIIRRLAKRAIINTSLEVRKKGKNIQVQKWECISERTALYTYRALNESLEITTDYIKKNKKSYAHSIKEEIINRFELPLDEIGNSPISSLIVSRLNELEIPLEDMAKSLNIKPFSLTEILSNKQKVSIDLIEKMLWLLNIKY